MAKLPQAFVAAADWTGLQAIGMAVRATEHKDGRRSCEVRYYTGSRSMSGRQFDQAVRGHWSIENSLDWQLDVTFGEDKSRVRQGRVRQGRADANVSLLRRSALSLLKNNKTRKVGVKSKRLAAGWDDGYRLQALCGA